MPLVADELVEVVPDFASEQKGGRLTLAPLERLVVPRALSGAHGENRSTAFCYIQANHDLDAVRAYLNRFRDSAENAARLHQGARAVFVVGGRVARQGAERSARGRL